MYIDQAYVTKQVSLVDKPAPRDFEQAALKKGLTRLLVQLWQHVPTSNRYSNINKQQINIEIKTRNHKILYLFFASHYP